MTELCGEPTKDGSPCTMRKGHQARYHRSREYDNISWTVYKWDGFKMKMEVAKGEGVNPLTTAISVNRNKGVKLLIEVSC